MIMSTFTGMDVPAVRSLAGQMNQCASEIRQVMNQLTHSLQNTQWVGPDREQFLSNWQGQHVTQLNQVAQSLEEASQRAQQNANEQEQASGGG
jgi:uncharacterized protein YukE